MRLLPPTFCAAFIFACQSTTPAPAEAPPPTARPGAPAPAAADPASAPTETVAPSGPDLARGGRLFDKWYADGSFEGTFVPAREGKPGQGGPNGDGTLNSGTGEPLPNTGHDYRLKSFFGWDLRGHAGVYGPEYQRSATVLPVNLLEDTRDASATAAWLSKGDAALPAFGAVLAEDQLRDVAAFIVAMREHRIPRPDDIWALSKTAPKGYTLKTGADVAAGRTYIESTCAGCHGSDGTAKAIDDKYSMGTYTRTKGYEIWLKILDGHPGSSMGSQVPEGATREDAARVILNVLAASCDRVAYPKLGNTDDVKNGDERCGAYLK